MRTDDMIDSLHDHVIPLSDQRSIINRLIAHGQNVSYNGVFRRVLIS